MAKSKFNFSKWALIALVLQSSLGVASSPKSKKPPTNLTSAEIIARALKYCRALHGSDATIGELKISSKPWRVLCKDQDQGFRVFQ
jgi:hypothetical protein